jgi:hypothetical protein
MPPARREDICLPDRGKQVANRHRHHHGLDALQPQHGYGVQDSCNLAARSEQRRIRQPEDLHGDARIGTQQARQFVQTDIFLRNDAEQLNGKRGKGRNRGHAQWRGGRTRGIGQNWHFRTLADGHAYGSPCLKPYRSPVGETLDQDTGVIVILAGGESLPSGLRTRTSHWHGRAMSAGGTKAERWSSPPKTVTRSTPPRTITAPGR